MNKLKQRLSILTLIMYLFFLPFFFFELYNIILGINSSSWEMTEGIVISNINYHKENNYCTTGRYGDVKYYKSTSVISEIKYKYYVNNKEYFSKRVSYHNTTSSYMMGNHIPVFYNKIIPSLSVIRRGYKFDPYLIFVFPIFIFIFSRIISYKKQLSLKN